MFYQTKQQKQREANTMLLLKKIDRIMELKIPLHGSAELKSNLRENDIQVTDDTFKLGSLITLLLNSISGKQLGKLMIDMNNINASNYVLIESDRKKR